MPEVFDSYIRSNDPFPDRLDMLRDAYVSALAMLGLKDGSPDDRLVLVAVIQEIAGTEVFRNPADIAKLAVDLYRARRG